MNELEVELCFVCERERNNGDDQSWFSFMIFWVVCIVSNTLPAVFFNEEILIVLFNRCKYKSFVFWNSSPILSIQR